jgi:hypothetical protein
MLVASLVLILGGLTSLGLQKRGHRARPSPEPPSPVRGLPASTLPPPPEVVPTPEGEIAWDVGTRAPVVTAINADGVEDFIGFFRVWDGLSAWIPYAGVFDGATLKPIWRTDPIDPRLVKQPGVVPLALVAGHRVVVADTSSTVRVYNLSGGEKELTLRLAGPVMDLCRAPDQETRVWVHILGGGDTMLDVATAKSELAPRPKWCPEAAYQNAAVAPLPRHPSPAELAANAAKKAEVAACFDAFENGVVAQASCRTPTASSSAEGFIPAYELVNGPTSVAFGTKNGRPHLASTVKGASWAHALVPDDANTKNAPPAVAEVAFGRVYVVAERVYFDSELVALDAKTGERLWKAPLVGSVPSNDASRGRATSLVATASRLYVVRSGGGLDVFDASSGQRVGALGKQ